MPKNEPRTYRILKRGTAIRCLVCKLVSHHPRDVSDRYCGKCKVFHHQQPLFEEVPMPIKPALRPLYRGKEYDELRERIVAGRAENHCEECGREQGEPYQNKRGKWVLTQLGMAHLDQNPRNNEYENLRALCRACHFKHDLKWHVEHARATRQARKDAARPLLAPILVVDLTLDDNR